jgi:hypothetical protein
MARLPWFWINAICDALNDDRHKLADLLVHRNQPPPDALEFIGWLLSAKPKHRPKLPDKFKVYRDMAKNPALFDAVMEYEQRRIRARNTGQRWEFKKEVTDLALRWNVEFDTLQNQVRRGKSGSKIMRRSQ